MRATTTPAKRRTRGIASAMVATALVALSILGSGTALAANPSWIVGYGTDSSLPAAQQPDSGASSTSVSAGQEVGFFEWLKNDGPSNISQLYLTASTDPVAAVAGANWTIKNGSTVVRSGTCPTKTPLKCTFGALNAGHTVYVVAAFTANKSLADGTTQGVYFEFNSTGVPPGSNQSHGDSQPIPDSVLISNNGDAAGDFSLAPTSLTVANNQKLTGQNKQATSVTVTGVQIGAAVNDNPLLDITCDPSLLPQPTTFTCDQLTSLVSVIEVGNGKIFNNPNGAGTPGIKVIVSFAKSPDQLSSATPFAYHYWVDASGAHAELITTKCTVLGNGFPSDLGPCLVVGNKQVTVWLLHNGPMKF
jgi:hypothetical protein